MRLIDADALRAEMYREAFETGTVLQKWDSGCWIRYRMFENAVDSASTVDAVPVVRCKDCKHHEDEELGMVYCPDQVGGWVSDDFFCKGGERRENDG